MLSGRTVLPFCCGTVLAIGLVSQRFAVADSGKTIEVVVSSASTGKPVEGVRVHVWGSRGPGQKTGKDGTARLEGLSAENPRVVVAAAGFAAFTSELDLTRAKNVTRMPVALQPGGVLRGVVVDEAGRPVEGVRVVGMSFFLLSELWLPTNARGEFRTDYLPLDQNLRVSIEKEGYNRQMHSLVLLPKRRDIQWKITLTKQPSGGGIEGVVHDEKGRPIAGANIENHNDRSREVRKTTSNRDGHYVLDKLLESSQGFRVVVLAPGKCPLEQAVQPGPLSKRAGRFRP